MSEKELWAPIVPLSNGKFPWSEQAVWLTVFTNFFFTPYNQIAYLIKTFLAILTILHIQIFFLIDDTKG